MQHEFILDHFRPYPLRGGRKVQAIMSNDWKGIDNFNVRPAIISIYEADNLLPDPL